MTRAAHDPTRSGAPVPAGDKAVRFSRSEIEAVAAKAARGAGFDWGVAEEAGMAARRLVESGIPGADILLACLEGPRGQAPDLHGRQWRAASGGLLCPLLTGCTLSDHAGMTDGPGGSSNAGEMSIRRLGHPALVLPFMLQAAARLGQNFRVTWEGAEVIVTPRGLFPALSKSLRVAEASEVAISILTDFAPPLKPIETGCRVALDTWRRLDAFALRTTVPASSSSRAGAGSAGGDND